MAKQLVDAKVKRSKRKNRRGNKLNVNSVHNNKFTVYFSNIRGVTSKKVSLQNIVSNPEVNADLIALVETNLKKSKKLDIDGYNCINSNRQSGNMGGVATLFKSNDKNHVVKITEGTEGNEFLITRHCNFKFPINVINIYGEQESRSTVDKVTENWNKILNEVRKIEARRNPDSLGHE